MLWSRQLGSTCYLHSGGAADLTFRLEHRRYLAEIVGPSGAPYEFECCQPRSTENRNRELEVGVTQP